MPLAPRLQARKNIDTRKWNEAVASSSSPSLYGYTTTLDHLCEHWDGFILGDYEAVMPVPWRRKFGIRYAFTPAFIQRLDVYGVNLNHNVQGSFVTALKQAFAFADVDLAFATGDNGLVRQVNYIKDLSTEISVIHNSYTTNAARSLRKAISRNCAYSTAITIPDVISLYRSAYGKKSAYTAGDYARLSAFAEYCKVNDKIMLRAVRHSATGEVLFGAMFFISSGRTYYLLGAPSPEGRIARAGYFIIDSVMSELAGTNLVFDFEGSDIASVAAFYRSFGPSEEIYYHLHHNRLPWIIRLFKK